MMLVPFLFFSCECATGFRGSTCSEIVDACDFEPCLNGGACSSIGMNVDGIGSPGFNCTCFPGFAGVTCGIEENLVTIGIVANRSGTSHDSTRLTDEISTVPIFENNVADQVEENDDRKKVSKHGMLVVVGASVVGMLTITIGIYAKLKVSWAKSI